MQLQSVLSSIYCIEIKSDIGLAVGVIQSHIIHAILDGLPLSSGDSSMATEPTFSNSLNNSTLRNNRRDIRFSRNYT